MAALKLLLNLLLGKKIWIPCENQALSGNVTDLSSEALSKMGTNSTGDGSESQICSLRPKENNWVTSIYTRQVPLATVAIISIYIVKTSQTTFWKVSPSLISSGENPRTDGYVIAQGLLGNPQGSKLKSPTQEPELQAPSETVPLGTNLVVSNGFSEPGTVQLQVNIRQLVQQLLWFKAVFLRVFHFQVTALRTTELLKIKVQHRSQSGSEFLGNHGIIGQFMLLRQARRTQTSHFSGGTGIGRLNLQRIPYMCYIIRWRRTFHSNFSLLSVSNPVILILRRMLHADGIFINTKKATFSLNSCFNYKNKDHFEFVNR